MQVELRTPRGVFDRGDPSAPYGSAPWAKSVHWDALAALRDTTSAAEALERRVRGLQESGGYQQLTDAQGQPFLLWDAYCTAPPPFGLGYSPAALEALIQERQAIQARERSQLAAVATDGQVLHRGGDQKSARAKESISKYEIDSQAERAQRTGVSAYTQHKLDYLARQAPALLADVRAGRRSVDAAYRQARGLPAPVTHVATVDGFARAACQRLTLEQRRALAARLVAE